MALGTAERQTLIVALREWGRKILAVPTLAATAYGQAELGRIRALVTELQETH